MFSPTERSSKRPSRCRSSGTNPIPSRIASAGRFITRRCPRIKISPRSAVSAPNRQRTSSDRLAPTRPVIDTISPRRTWRSMSWNRPSRARPLHSRATGASASASSGLRDACSTLRSSRPSIARTSDAREVSAMLPDIATLPSRSTVTRCAISKISSRTWRCGPRPRPGRRRRSNQRAWPLPCRTTTRLARP